MELSARNHLPGVVKTLKLGNVMAEVVLDVVGNTVTAVITRASAERLRLKEGDRTSAGFKATEVMIAKG